jgi:hypothetical protein
MKVRELIESLQKQDPDAYAFVAAEPNATWHGDVAVYAPITLKPTTSPCVVIVPKSSIL